MGSKVFAWRESPSRLIFMFVILIQALIVGAIEAYVYSAVISKFSQFSQFSPFTEAINDPNNPNNLNDPNKSLLVYLVIFIMSQIFQLYMALEAMAYKNTLQIIGIVVFNIMTTAYSWVQYYQVKEALKETFKVALKGADVPDVAELIYRMKIILACLGSAMIVCELVLIYFGYKLYQEFGWSIYRLIGSDLTMRRMYLNYQMLLMFLKFDVFFFVGFSIQFLVFGLKKTDPEFWITLAAIPLSLLILIGVIQGVRRENKVITLVSMAGFLVGLAYFIFKVYRLFDHETSYKYTGYTIFLALFAVLSIIVLTISYILSLICFLNFGKGLERHIHPSNALNLERPPQTHIDLGDE